MSITKPKIDVNNSSAPVLDFTKQNRIIEINEW
jgi:hypothetical protein